MDRAPVVALGAKDRSSPSIGQRMANHFNTHRAVYGSVGVAVAGAAGAAGAAYLGHEIGHAAGHRSGLEKGHLAGRKYAQQLYSLHN